MTPAGKYSLTLKQKKKFSIPPSAESYTFIWDQVADEDCQLMEDFLTNDGFKIVEKELKNSNIGLPDYYITAYRP